MRIESIRIDGLKGGPVEYDLAPIVLVEGPNGAGKSRVMDAVRFLFGGEPAGVSVDGRSMADLMDGGRLYVEAVIVDGDERTIASRERVMDDGTFRRSVVRINGEIADPSALPSVRLGAGRPLVNASEDVTAAELARIGAGQIDAAPIGLLESSVAEVVDGWSPSVGDEAGERIGAVFAAIKAERKRLRGAQSEAAASAERSRQMFGTVHVRIGEAAQHAQAAEVAAHDVAQISRDIGSIEGQIGAAEMARKRIDRRLNERDAAVAADLDALRAAADRARLDHEPAQEGRDRAGDALAAANEAFSAAERAVAAADDRVERAQARRDDAAGAAALLDGAPCRRSTEWVTIDEIAANPLTSGVDLCGSCALSSSARGQERALDEADDRLAGEVASQAAARQVWAEAADMLRRAKADDSAAADSEIALRRQMDAAVGALRRAERAAGLSAEDADRLRGEFEAYGAEIARLSQMLRQRRDDLARAIARRTDATRKASEMRVAEERLRRLRSDEDRARDVEARIEALKTLTALAKRVRARFVEAGLDAIREHGGQIVAWMHRLDVDGRVGLRDDAGRFWSGPGLSAAQAEMMGAALDVAIARLDGAAYRPAMIEADPLDGRARAEVLAAIERSIEAGDVTQSFVASWLRIENAPPGAVRVEVRV